MSLRWWAREIATLLWLYPQLVAERARTAAALYRLRRVYGGLRLTDLRAGLRYLFA